MDDVCPKFLKVLDVVGLSWLKHFDNVVWKSGVVPFGLADQGGDSHLKEVGLEHVLQLKGNHAHQPSQEILCQGNGKESPSVSQTSATGGIMWF